MKIPILYKGTDIEFSIQIWQDQLRTIPVNLDDLLEIVCHIYTTQIDIKLFSKTNRTPSYVQLIRISATEYKGILEGIVSAGMKSGDMTLEIWTATTDSQISTGRFKSAGRGIIGNLYDISTKNEI